MTYDFELYARRKANRRYLRDKVDTLMIRMPKGTKPVLADLASRKGLSLNKLLNQIILNYLDQLPSSGAD